MLDIRYIKENPDEVLARLAKKGKDAKAEIEQILTALDSGEYGMILRSKGMVPAEDGTWVYFDYVPEEHDIRAGKPAVTGKLCVIGSKLEEEKIAALFRV